MFTILAIVIYMLACAACIGFFTRKAEGIPHKNVLLHIVCPVLGLIVFLAALYGQYFSFDQFFKPAFTTFPLNWIGWSALIWLGARRRRHAVHALGEAGGARPGHARVRRRVGRAGPRRAGRVDVDLALAHFRLPVRGASKRGRSGGKAAMSWRPILGGLTTSCRAGVGPRRTGRPRPMGALGCPAWPDAGATPMS